MGLESLSELMMIFRGLSASWAAFWENVVFGARTSLAKWLLNAASAHNYLIRVIFQVTLRRPIPWTLRNAKPINKIAAWGAKIICPLWFLRRRRTACWQYFQPQIVRRKRIRGDKSVELRKRTEIGAERPLTTPMRVARWLLLPGW
jgi:hypothetical protein